MSVRMIIPPAALAVSLDAARDHARVNGTAMDGEITDRVEALTAEAEHLTGRAIVNRTYELALPAFPERIEMPAAPVADVTSVKYFDGDGVERTLAPAAYLIDPGGPGFIDPAPGTSWPSTQAGRWNAVTVTVVCGYGPDHTTTPPAFKGFILAKVKEYFAPAGTPESPHLVRALDSLTVY